MIPPSRVYATRGALEAAERLLPGRVLELEVEKAILADRIRRRPLHGTPVRLAPDERFVIIDTHVAATIAKHPSPHTRRPAWLVTRLLALRPTPRAA